MRPNQEVCKKCNGGGYEYDGKWKRHCIECSGLGFIDKEIMKPNEKAKELN